MKKLVSLFLCLILLMGVLPLAATPVRAESEGDWEYTAYSWGDYAVITKYIGAGGSVSIPSKLGGQPVKEIGSSAFSSCTGLTTVTIPNSVNIIGAEAFSGCFNLRSVTIPNNVTSIGWNAFSSCTSLTNVTIPRSVTFIGGDAFKDCSSLTRVNINDLASWCAIEFGYGESNPLFYSHRLYINGSVITDLTIPSGVKSIGKYAFTGCSSLTSVTIPPSVESIGYYAFYGCNGLARVNISDLDKWCSISFGDLGINGAQCANPLVYAHVLYIDGEAVTKLVIPSGVTSIGACAFDGCSAIRSVTIPRSVINIGNYAFSDCSNMTSVNIPENTTSIGSYAFYNCSGLTDVIIPSSITSIGSYVFYGCSRLTSVSIPNSITSIGDYAFYGCSSLSSLIIPDSVTSIGNFVFDECSSLTSVAIPNSVISIGTAAFQHCNGLRSLIIPKSVINIGSYAFNTRSNSLISAGPIGSSYDYQYGWMTSIPDNAFNGISQLQVIVIPATIKEIRQNAFYGCSNLHQVYYGGTAAQWEKILVLGGNTPLVNAELHYGYKTGDPLIVASGSCGDSLTWTLDHKGKLTVSGTGIMNSSPFDYSTRQMIRSVVINNGATSVGSYAFSNCQDLTSVTIPRSVTSIGSGAFFGCTSLTEVYYGGTEAEWNTINIGYDNAPLTSATIHYTEPLAITGITADKTGTVTGEPLTWTASATGGSGALKYYFILYKDGAKVTTRAYSTANSFTYTPTEPGTYRVRVYVKDALDTKVNKLSSGVKVTGPITVTGITADTDHAAVGEAITWSASASGGEGTLQYWFRIYKDGTVVKKGTYGTAQTFTYIPTEPGAYKAKVYVKDAVGTTVNKLSTAVPVTEPLAITGITANKTGAVTGEPLTWTASATGGSGTLKYYFILYKDGTKVTTRAYSTANTFSYTPAEPGTYRVRVYVKDSLDTKVNKLSSGVKTTQAITVTGIMADKTSAVLGAAITWSAAAVGGEGTLQYWFRIYKDGTVVKKGTYGTVQAFTYTPTEPGVYKAKVYVKDAAGTTVSKLSTAVTVTEPLAITGIKANKPSAVAGETLTWTASAVGGTGTLQYYFIVYKDGVKVKTRAYSTTNTYSYTPTEAGTYKVRVYVKDAAETKVNKLSGGVTVTG